MASLQAHRGPDEGNTWIDPGGHLGFGHRRLSIIDLSPGGRQPMLDSSGELAICYNGEIYNYVELADRLAALGRTFRSRSDTEVILEAYRTWGASALRELNGMFAFALYDARKRTLICARDRFGEKPFLYAAGPDYFAFASEYKALLALREVDGTPDMAAALRFLQNGKSGLDDEPVTAFPSIRQLLPGEMLTLDIDTLTCKVERYWTLAPVTATSTARFDDAVAEFRDLLSDSIRLRLRSDVTVGSCLSGGLDSSAIVVLVRELLGRDTPYHVFTGRFPGTPADEGPYADAVVHATGTIPHRSEPAPEKLLAEFPDFVWHNELPVSSASQYAQWCVFRTAREAGITVLLDGQGGDELLAGYEQYFQAYCSERQAAPGASTEREAIRRRYPQALPTASMAFKRALPDSLRRYLARQTGRGSDFLFGLSADAADAVLAGRLGPRQGGFSGLRGTLYEDSFHTTLPSLLRYGDRNSMAHSREVRLPFCDHRLAEFVFQLPPDYLMGNIQTKRLLRGAMRNHLPPMITERWNKQGFVPPQDIWFRGPLLGRLEDMLADASFAGSGLWNVPWWRRVITRARQGASGLGSVLWKLLIAEMWRRHFVERVQTSEKLSLFAPG